jgi:two-component system NtrC family response regulator
MARILLIDTDERFIETLSAKIRALGHQVDAAGTMARGLELAETDGCDVVFLNPVLPDGNGMDALPMLIEAPSYPEVIMVTDTGSPDQAEQAIKMGAWDYVERPAFTSAMELSLVRAIQYRAKKILRQPHTTLKEETLGEIVGVSAPMRRSLDRLALSAASDANVLISGETGTGKELFAWAIHNNSRRVGKRFVVVDCATLPETLVESILFGHERGAFTGADKTHSGLIKRADGGTLFLDEVGEMPLTVQKSFLRVLQEHRFRQVGGGPEIRSDFRLIAASNRDLNTLVHERRFRKDLLFRLRAFSIELPPLRERIEDIRAIAVHHVARLCASYALPAKTFSPDCLELLDRYEWPGNVRELVNALERAVSVAQQAPVLFAKHLPVYIRVHLARASVVAGQDATADLLPGAPPGTPLPPLSTVRETAVAEAEQRYLRELLRRAASVSEATAVSGLSRSRLYALLKKHDLVAAFRTA